jgi:hypothetical protein
MFLDVTLILFPMPRFVDRTVDFLAFLVIWLLCFLSSLTKILEHLPLLSRLGHEKFFPICAALCVLVHFDSRRRSLYLALKLAFHSLPCFVLIGFPRCIVSSKSTMTCMDRGSFWTTTFQFRVCEFGTKKPDNMTHVQYCRSEPHCHYICSRYSLLKGNSNNVMYTLNA